MDLTAYCLCAENLTWQQLVNGAWSDITNQFSPVTTTTWDFTPTQAQIDEGTITIRYCCDAECTAPSQVTFQQPGTPQIALTKSGTPSSIADAEPGDTINYTFTVQNTGTVALTGVSITDPLIAITGGPISLAPTATDSTTFTGTYAITQADIDNGSVVNTATASGTSPEGPTSSNDSETTTLTPPDPGNPAISLTKIADPTSIADAQPGDTISYTFVVQNTGDVPLTGVSVTDPLLTVTGGTINLPVNATDTTTFTGTYAITQADIDAGQLLNTATVNAGSVDGPATDTANATVTLDAVEPCAPTLVLPAEYQLPTEPGVCEELPASSINVDIIPDDPNTWGPNRPDGQWIIAGDRFNTGDTTGNILGLTFANNEVNSFQMQNGETRRLWADTVNGLPALCGQYQFVDDGSYQPPPAGPTGQGNVNSPPSDPLFFDGSRIDLSFTGTPAVVGPGCTEFKTAITFMGEPWHQATDATTALWELHTPIGQGGTSPVGLSIQNGQLELFSQYGTTPVVPGTNPNNVTTRLTLGTVPINIGQWNTIIVEGCVDPGGAGYVRLHTVDENGTCNLQISRGNDFGYTFSDPTINQNFYHQLKQYDFHQFPQATAPNWDDTYGNVRRQCYASWTLSHDPACTTAQICDHAVARAGLCPPETADVELFSDIITTPSTLCGPCGDPAAPQPPLYWEKLVNGVWTVTALPLASDPTVQDGDQWRYVCPDGPSSVITVSTETDNVAQGLDAPTSAQAPEGGPVDLSGFTCSDGSPIDEWQVSFDNGISWVSGFTPDTVGNIAWDCTKWRFRCDNDWSDAELTYDIAASANTYVDTTIQIDEGVQGFYSICVPCGTGNQLWQYRIDDAYADEDHVDAPNVVTGDRPNSDPGDPTPDDEWQTLPYYGCKDCATFNIEEIHPDGIDPDNQLGEFFVFYLRTSCDNGATWLPEIRITLET